MPTERSRFFQVRISDTELRMLNSIADADGLTASDVVRQLVRREFVTRWKPDARVTVAPTKAKAKRGTAA
jgi:hypothetical protein